MKITSQSFLEVTIEVQIEWLFYSNSTVFATNQHEPNSQLHVRKNGQLIAYQHQTKHLSKIALNGNLAQIIINKIFITICTRQGSLLFYIRSY